MIRTARKKDIPEITGLMKSELGFWDETWRDNALEIGIVTADGLALVCENKGKIVGFICAHDLGFRAYLSVLIVGQKYRKKGIAKALINRIENVLSERGCKIIISDVWRGSVEFYRAIGWSQPDVILMRKNLT